MGGKRQRRVDVRVMPAVIQILASIVAIGSTPTSVTVPGVRLEIAAPQFIGGSVAVGDTERLLQEDSALLLQESGDQILLDIEVVVAGETFTPTITFITGSVTADNTGLIAQEDGDRLLQETGDYLQIETLPPANDALTDVSGNYLTDVSGNYLLGVT